MFLLIGQYSLNRIILPNTLSAECTYIEGLNNVTDTNYRWKCLLVVIYLPNMNNVVEYLFTLCCIYRTNWLCFIVTKRLALFYLKCACYRTNKPNQFLCQCHIGAFVFATNSRCWWELRKLAVAPTSY